MHKSTSTICAASKRYMTPRVLFCGVLHLKVPGTRRSWHEQIRLFCFDLGQNKRGAKQHDLVSNNN